MRLLVLGGTRFVGRHLVEAALRDGHAVTLFNRGTSAPGLFPGAAALLGDRAGDHAALKDGVWDAVVDVSGYRPESVRAAAAALRGRASRYVFVSTVSVCRDFQEGGAEDAATWDPAAATPEQAGPDLYGPRKRACELALAEAWRGPWCVARPCVVAGPHDPTDRFTYWPVRLARGGRVLVPGAASAFAQFVDARDLADFLLKAAAGGPEGIFNVVGPASPFPEFLAACGAGAGAELVAAPDDFLLKEGVAPYVDLPLWIPGRTKPFDGAKAAAAGFRSRPIAQTAADVRRGRGCAPLAAGLSAEREARLLAELGSAA